MTSSSTTGHLAMFHTVTVTSLSPMVDPIDRARSPDRTTATTTSTAITISTTVMPSCSGRSFQIGRPSSIS